VNAIACLSFVVPAHNELASLPALLTEIRAAASAIGGAHEIVVVDDGSNDGSDAWLAEEAARAGDVVVVSFAHNAGQSAALAAGLDAARGDRLVTLDADLQNDPADAPRQVAALADHDLVCGVRTTRRDVFAKRAGSRIANFVRRVALHDRFRDVGCGLKAWRRPVVDALPRFRGFHRFLPVLAEAEGFRVVEIEVSHRARRYGATHYGELGRALRGFRDMLGVRWLIRRRLPRPPQRSGTPSDGARPDPPRSRGCAASPRTVQGAPRS
jgi:dolichol-phosphate mannosyltransferase